MIGFDAPPVVVATTNRPRNLIKVATAMPPLSCSRTIL